MRVLLWIIVLGAICGGVYFYFFADSKGTVEVTGNLQISKQSNFDINAPQVSAPLYLAVVKGQAKNNSTKNLKNVFIKYTVGGKNSSAMIFDLAPGQQVTFTTKGINTRASNPTIQLDDIQYEDISM